MIAKVRVLAARMETPTVRVVRFERPAGFRFAPVQFVGLELATAGGSEEYPMSLASSPTRDYLEVGARLSASPWKRAFAALREGDVAEVDGPYGHFVLDEARPAVYLAGGIGITPLRGMLQYAADLGLQHAQRLVFSNRAAAEIPFRAELDALAEANPRMRVWHTLTRPEPGEAWQGPTGRIGPALLDEATAGLEDPAYYVCGTPGMVQGTVALLRQRGVPAARIHQERFLGYDGP